MKKLILILFTTFSFAQNGIEAYEGDGRVLTQEAALYNVFFLRTQQIKKVFVTPEVLAKSNLTELTKNKIYNFQIYLSNGKPIVYYVCKSDRQNALDIRKEQEEISPILRPTTW